MPLKSINSHLSNVDSYYTCFLSFFFCIIIIIIFAFQIVRAEFCTVLRALIIKFSSRKPFDGLVKITDNDPDLDFFENIKHIQVSDAITVKKCQVNI